MDDSHSVQYNLLIFTLNKNKQMSDNLPERIKIRPLKEPRAYENVKVALQVKNEPENVEEYELRCHLVTTDAGDRLNLSPNMLKTESTKEPNYKPVIKRIQAHKMPAGPSTNFQQYEFDLDFWIGSGKVKEVNSILAKKYEEAEKLYKIEELCEEHNRMIPKQARNIATDFEKKASDFFHENKKPKLFLAFDVYQKFSNGQLVRAIRKYSNEIVDGNSMNINVLCTTHVPMISADNTGTLVYLMVRDILFPYRMIFRYTIKTNETERENMILIEPSTVVASHRSLSYKIPDYPNQNDRRSFIPCKLQLISDSGRSVSNVVDLYYVNVDIPNQISLVPMSVDIPQAVDQFQYPVEITGPNSTDGSQLLPEACQLFIESRPPDGSLALYAVQGQSTGCQSATMDAVGYQPFQQPADQLQRSETLTGQNSTQEMQYLAESHQQLIEDSWAPDGSLETFYILSPITGSRLANVDMFNDQTLQQQSTNSYVQDEYGNQTVGSENSQNPLDEWNNIFCDAVNEVKQRPMAHTWKDHIETDVFKSLNKLEKLIKERLLTAVEIICIVTKLNRDFMKKWNTKKPLLEHAIEFDQFYQFDRTLFLTINDENVLNDVRKLIGSMYNHRRETLLHAACKYNKSDFIYTLLDMRPDAILVQNISGDTPLHLAIKYNSFGVLETLTELDVFRESTQFIELLDMHNIGGRTVLHLAIENNNRPLVRMLLKQCVQHKKNAFNSRVLGCGKTLLHLAVDLPGCDSTAMIELIKEYCEEAEKYTNYAGYNPYGVYQDDKFGVDDDTDDNECDQDDANDDDVDEKDINRIAKRMQQVQI